MALAASGCFGKLAPAMKLFIWVGMFVGGIAGWHLGAYFGGFWFPYFVSGLGSLFGIVAGWKFGKSLE